MTNKITKKLPKEFVVTQKDKVIFYKFVPVQAHFKKLTIDRYGVTILGVIENYTTGPNHTQELIEVFSIGVIVPDGTWDKHVKAVTKCMKEVMGEHIFKKDK